MASKKGPGPPGDGSEKPSKIIPAPVSVIPPSRISNPTKPRDDERRASGAATASSSPKPQTGHPPRPPAVKGHKIPDSRVNTNLLTLSSQPTPANTPVVQESPTTPKLPTSPEISIPVPTSGSKARLASPIFTSFFQRGEKTKDNRAPYNGKDNVQDYSPEKIEEDLLPKRLSLGRRESEKKSTTDPTASHEQFNRPFRDPQSTPAVETPPTPNPLGHLEGLRPFASKTESGSTLLPLPGFAPSTQDEDPTNPILNRAKGKGHVSFKFDEEPKSRPSSKDEDFLLTSVLTDDDKPENIPADLVLGGKKGPLTGKRGWRLFKEGRPKILGDQDPLRVGVAFNIRTPAQRMTLSSPSEGSGSSSKGKYLLHKPAEATKPGSDGNDEEEMGGEKEGSNDNEASTDIKEVLKDKTPSYRHEEEMEDEDEEIEANDPLYGESLHFEPMVIRHSGQGDKPSDNITRQSHPARAGSGQAVMNVPIDQRQAQDQLEANERLERELAARGEGPDPTIRRLLAEQDLAPEISAFYEYANSRLEEECIKMGLAALRASERIGSDELTKRLATDQQNRSLINPNFRNTEKIRDLEKIIRKKDEDCATRLRILTEESDGATREVASLRQQLATCKESNGEKDESIAELKDEVENLKRTQPGLISVEDADGKDNVIISEEEYEERFKEEKASPKDELKKLKESISRSCTAVSRIQGIPEFATRNSPSASGDLFHQINTLYQSIQDFFKDQNEPRKELVRMVNDYFSTLQQQLGLEGKKIDDNVLDKDDPHKSVDTIRDILGLLEVMNSKLDQNFITSEECNEKIESQLRAIRAAVATIQKAAAGYFQREMDTSGDLIHQLDTIKTYFTHTLGWYKEYEKEIKDARVGIEECRSSAGLVKELVRGTIGAAKPDGRSLKIQIEELVAELVVQRSGKINEDELRTKIANLEAELQDFKKSNAIQLKENTGLLTVEDCDERHAEIERALKDQITKLEKDLSEIIRVVNHTELLTNDDHNKEVAFRGTLEEQIAVVRDRLLGFETRLLKDKSELKQGYDTLNKYAMDYEEDESEETSMFETISQAIDQFAVELVRKLTNFDSANLITTKLCDQRHEIEKKLYTEKNKSLRQKSKSVREALARLQNSQAENIFDRQGTLPEQIGQVSSFIQKLSKERENWISKEDCDEAHAKIVADLKRKIAELEEDKREIANAVKSLREGHEDRARARGEATIIANDASIRNQIQTFDKLFTRLEIMHPVLVEELAEGRGALDAINTEFRFDQLLDIPPSFFRLRYFSGERESIKGNIQELIKRIRKRFESRDAREMIPRWESDGEKEKLKKKIEELEQEIVALILGQERNSSEDEEAEDTRSLNEQIADLGRQVEIYKTKVEQQGSELEAFRPGGNRTNDAAKDREIEDLKKELEELKECYKTYDPDDYRNALTRIDELQRKVDELKAQLRDSNGDSGSLQQQTQILKSKNKKLEKLARVAEKKCNEEKEGFRGEIRQLRRALMEAKSERRRKTSGGGESMDIKPSHMSVEFAIFRCETALKDMVNKRALNGFHYDDTHEAIDSIQEGLELAENLNDDTLRTRTNFWAGIAHYYADETSLATNYFNTAQEFLNWTKPQAETGLLGEWMQVAAEGLTPKDPVLYGGKAETKRLRSSNLPESLRRRLKTKTADKEKRRRKRREKKRRSSEARQRKKAAVPQPPIVDRKDLEFRYMNLRVEKRVDGQHKEYVIERRGIWVPKGTVEDPPELQPDCINQ